MKKYLIHSFLRLLRASWHSPCPLLLLFPFPVSHAIYSISENSKMILNHSSAIVRSLSHCMSRLHEYSLEKENNFFMSIFPKIVSHQSSLTYSQLKLAFTLDVNSGVTFKTENHIQNLLLAILIQEIGVLSWKNWKFLKYLYTGIEHSIRIHSKSIPNFWNPKTHYDSFRFINLSS